MIRSFGFGTVAYCSPLHFAALFQLGYLPVGGLGKTGAAFIHVHPENFVQPLKSAGLEAVNRGYLDSCPVLIFIHALLLELQKLVGRQVIQCYHPLGDQGEIGVQIGVTPIFAVGQRVVNKAFGKVLVKQMAIY